LIGGWSLDGEQLHIGFARLLFPFIAGVLLMRLRRRIDIRRSFEICAVLLIVALTMPRIGGAGHRWLNGLYESACVIILFPLVVAIGAGASRTSGLSARVAKFFGDLSYPLYITHYGLIYTYTEWVSKHEASPAATKVVGALVFFGCITVAYAALKLYDEPLRKWLGRKYAERAS
jgi:peptidoglycan/LPS O-acetylase OafA/YrhL